jgi:ATP-binding cassette subfamily F protein 3
VIQGSNLYKAYGQQVIFDDIGFTVNAGERIGLVGRNGHGKTTLFKMILGEEKPDSGVISIPNHYKIGHLSQHISFTEDSILKEGCLSLSPAEDGRDETYRVETVLMGIGFSEEDFTRNPFELSGGYQIEQDTQALLEVSVKGEGQSIKTLSKSIHESKARIDTLFDELSSLTEELDIKIREFEERLEGLDD